ncbi:MAG: DUF72 domain-containing protein [Gemmatimonadetes bacterium]|nr:DUF72 domain-containing protein [Gemmatimonadota bacterium]
MSAGVLRFGAQGWNYPAWVGPFYPAGTKPADFLTMYARAFDTVEVDSTFYAIPPAKTVQGWARRTPPNFTFSLKLPQEITHERRLRDAGDPLLRFLDVTRALGDKLGPILIQCGPDFGPAELPALAGFLPLLPPDMRFAIEFRQRGWITEGVVALLKEYRVALALSDGKWIPRQWLVKLAEDPTTDFAYLRWMGPDRSIVDYSRIQVDRSKEIATWVGTLRGLMSRVTTAYGYVNNHFAGHSPASIRMLQEGLGMKTIQPELLGEQLGLF